MKSDDFLFSIPAKLTPFQISFYSDNWEYSAAAAGKTEAEQTTSGFSLKYTQSTC
jgi:hypothetical protein